MNRLDFIKISEWIKPNSKVLDLGCADGALLKYLHAEKMIAGYGIEIIPENIEKGIKNKINIIQMNLEDGLSVFDNQFFDTVILSQTLQAMVNIEKIMDEMKRVAKNIIVSFPNFGYWKNRLQILNGKMPKSSDLPHEWYNTPNINMCSIKDFFNFCNDRNINLYKSIALQNLESSNIDKVNLGFKNLSAVLGIFLIEK